MDLDFTSAQRNDVLNNLSAIDYYKGPDEDRYDPYGSPVWEFGTNVKNKEIYIKISLGKKISLCFVNHFISLNEKLIYPLKKVIHETNY